MEIIVCHGVVFRRCSEFQKGRLSTMKLPALGADLLNIKTDCFPVATLRKRIAKRGSAKLRERCIWERELISPFSINIFAQLVPEHLYEEHTTKRVVLDWIICFFITQIGNNFFPSLQSQMELAVTNYRLSHKIEF